MFKPESNTNKLFLALQKGQKLTEAQIASRFKIANPSATVSYIRSKGINVNYVVSKRGRVETGRYTIV